MTVSEMRDRIDNREWAQWSIYYSRIAQQRELELAKLR